MLDTETCFCVGHINAFLCPCCRMLMMSCWIGDHVGQGNLFLCWTQIRFSLTMLQGVNDVLLDRGSSLTQKLVSVSDTEKCFHVHAAGC